MEPGGGQGPGEGEAFDRAVGIVLDGLGVPRPGPGRLRSKAKSGRRSW
ncbi:hypothetical protein [Streptomyces sp. MNP-20]|nr:hypothetical protein [Streptomyces sp. MNP-20]